MATPHTESQIGSLDRTQWTVQGQSYLLVPSRHPNREKGFATLSGHSFGGVVGVAVGLMNVSTTDYLPGEGLAMLVDFGAAAGFTFLFWYGVVLLVGWVMGKVRRET